LVARELDRETPLGARKARWKATQSHPSGKGRMKTAECRTARNIQYQRPISKAEKRLTAEKAQESDLNKLA
jgi:hypothetical protein